MKYVTSKTDWRVYASYGKLKLMIFYAQFAALMFTIIYGSPNYCLLRFLASKCMSNSVNQGVMDK